MTKPKHILLIQADDLGIDDLGYSGNPLAHTPHIDDLARNAMQAFDFTVNPVCAASRASLLTGRHFLKTGVSHVHGGKDFLHLEERIFPQVLRDHGWRTGMWGKWHLGTATGYQPWERGFDQAYSAFLYEHHHTHGLLNGSEVKHPKHWCDDVIVDYALEFLDQSDAPGFFYLPSMTPHGPLDAPEKWVDFHKERGQTEGLATLNAMVSTFDAAIGRLMNALKDRGLWESTLILFTSDNGPAINRGILTDEERRLRKISARRGWKGDIWENGVRAPLLIHWPDHIQPSVLRRPLDQIDLLPTILEWCGLQWPTEYPPLDGVSRRPEIEQASAIESDEEPQAIFNYAHQGWITSRRAYDPAGILNEYNPVHAEDKHQLQALEQPISMRKGRYKFLLNPYPPEMNHTPERVLIDLLEDPGECCNLVKVLPEVANAMERSLTSWFEDIKKSAHSFTAPVFTISPNDATRIPARMPTRLEGALQNTVSDLRGWQSGAAGASYQIDASHLKEDSAVTVTLTASAPLPAGWSFEIECDKISVSTRSDGTPTLEFPALILKPQSSLLTLRTRNAGDADTNADIRLIELKLTPPYA